jgi:anti-anti-sigma regulatory factor
MVTCEEYMEEGIVVLTPTEKWLTADVIREIDVLSIASAAKHVIVDFKQIQCIVSASLFPDAEPFGPLFRLHFKLQKAERRLVLCELDPSFAEILQVTRYDKIFLVQPDLKKARSAALRSSTNR